MPRLPSAADFNRPTPQPAGGIATINGAGVPSFEGQARMGAAVQEVAQTFQHELDKLDEIKAEDATNKLMQKRLDLTAGENGAFKVKGIDVMTPDFHSKYTEQFKAYADELSQGLTARQKARFQNSSSKIGLGLQADILNHATVESERAQDLTHQAKIANAASMGTMGWNNERLVGEAVTMALESTQKMAERKGLSPDVVEKLQRDAVSPIYASVIESALDAKNIPYAEQVLNSTNGMLDPGAMLKYRELVQKQKEGLDVTAKAAETATSSLPLDQMGALSRAVSKTESNGNHVVDGKIVEGPLITAGPAKGQKAVGKWQILPSTGPEAAKAAGVPWNKELFNSPTKEGEAYHEKLYSGYIETLLKKYNGDLPKALAAYNGGMGNVDKAVAKFEKYDAQRKAGIDVIGQVRNKTGVGPATSFLDFMPQPETSKKYVTDTLLAYKAGVGTTETPTEMELMARGKKMYPDRPDLVAAYVKTTQSQIKMIDDSVKQKSEDAKEKIYGYMAMGRKIDEVPPSLMANLSLADQKNVEEDFTAYYAKNDRDSNPGLLYQINKDPAVLANMSRAQWESSRASLSNYDWARFDKQRSSMMGGETKDWESLDSGTVHRVVSSRLQALNIDPTPKEFNKDGVATVNTTRAIVDKSILLKQQQLKRRMTDAEVMGHVNELFDKDITLKESTLGYSYDKKTKVMAVKTVPSRDKQTIVEEFKKINIQNPTNTQILQRYKEKLLTMAGL